MTKNRDETLDELLGLLADSPCRALLSQFHHSPVQVYEASALAEKLAEDMDAREDQVVIQLRHLTLPRLEDAGVIDYDPRSNTVRYLGHSGLEALLDAIMECQVEQNGNNDGVEA